MCFGVILWIPVTLLSVCPVDSFGGIEIEIQGSEVLAWTFTSKVCPGILGLHVRWVKMLTVVIYRRIIFVTTPSINV